MMRLILASASPRRVELLKAAGYTFEVRPVDIDERPRDGEAPRAYVERLAMEKSARAETGRDPADAAFAEASGRAAPEIILAADTTVVVDGVMLAKPADDVDAERMLRLLSGRAHQVMTGVSVRQGSEERHGVEVTDVWFAPLTRDDIAWYVSSGEGRDKAGAYAIQGLASRFIPRIDGSYSNVVGLPLALVHHLLTEIRHDAAKTA
jgi:septum formation protein